MSALFVGASHLSLFTIGQSHHGRRDGTAAREKIAAQKAAIAELPSLKRIVEQTGLTSPETIKSTTNQRAVGQ